MFKIYRITSRATFDGLKLALWPGFFFALSGLLLRMGFVANAHPSPAQQLFIIGMWLGTLVLGAPTLFLILLSVLNGVFGYLKISSIGLEYWSWPRGKIWCGWDAVERIASGTLPAVGPGLLIRRTFATLVIRRARPSWELRIGSATFGSAKYHYVALSDLQGWDDGELLMQLRAYAPHLQLT